MPFVHRPVGWQHARPWLSAMAVALLLLAALAGSAAAQSGWSSLHDVSVSPRLGRPSTTVRFGVTFQDRQDRPPTAVRVLIDGTPRAMQPGTGTGSDHGLAYTYATKLAAGRHLIRFDATDADGRRHAVDGGSVWIRSTGDGTSPGGGSSPAGGSASGPEGATPSPPNAGGGTTTPDPKGDPSGGASSPTKGGGSHDGADGSAGSRNGHRPAGSHDQAPGRAGTGPSSTAPAGPAPDVAEPAAEPASVEGAVPPPGLLAESPADDAPRIGPGEAAPGRATAPGSDGGSAAPSGLDRLGLGGGPFDQVFRAYPVLITSSGTAVVWAAFVIFGKRRRDGEPPAPDEVLALHAASALGPLPAVDLVPPVVQRELPPGVEPDEADLPRWRRPSLLQARKADPLRMVSTAVSLSFADTTIGAGALADGGERRRIRYRLVRLLDVPDEATGRELAVLDAGDEVQIVEDYGIYRLVLCPDGTRGWLHKMVLGELVDEDPTLDEVPDGIDEDVLTAFLAARRQTA